VIKRPDKARDSYESSRVF